MASADVLNYMQMEALGLHRREKILTSDHPENSESTFPWGEPPPPLTVCV